MKTTHKAFAERTNVKLPSNGTVLATKKPIGTAVNELSGAFQKHKLLPNEDHQKLGKPPLHGRGYLSPFEMKKAALEKEREKQGRCHYMVVTGLGVNNDHKALTKAQVDKLRIIMMPKSRIHDCKVIREIVLGYQMMEDSRNAMIASFAYELLDAFDLVFKRLYHYAASPAKKFNYLFAFTDCFLDHTVWETSERGWDEENLIGDLSILWKNLCQQYSAEELGLDTAFSEPGVQAFLQKSKKKIESIPMYGRPKLQFDF